MTIKNVHFDLPFIFYFMLYVGIILLLIAAFKTVYQIQYEIIDRRLKTGEFIRSSKLPVETYRQFARSDNYRKVRYIGKEKIFIKIK